MNRREMLGAVAGIAGAAAMPSVGNASATTYTSHEYYSYDDVGQATMTEPGSNPMHYWLEVDDRWIEVSAATYYSYMFHRIWPEKYYDDVKIFKSK